MDSTHGDQELQQSSLERNDSQTYRSQQARSSSKDRNYKTEQFETLDNEDLRGYVNEKDLPKSIYNFIKDQGIIGENLKYLTTDLLLKYGVGFADSLKLLECVDRKLLKKGKGTSVKIYNDPIHGHIEVNPVCQAIIDTPQFQRLRFLKQLGMCYFVFPGAAHNRFEHSLGVYHLAGNFARTLQQNQPELCINENDILCVEIAGLCHDLGHGPFSHVFDDKFLPKVNPCNKIKHEKAGVAMFEDLITANTSVQIKFSNFGIKEEDITFIKEQIGGPLKTTGSADWPYKGRKQDKAFLYEIVCNRRNGIDVNKWDYLARDCHHLGFHNNFDYARYMMFARVIEEDGELQICIRDKEISNLYNMFYTRYTLDKYAYQHKVNCGLEIMVSDALIHANDYIEFQGNDGNILKISECITDMAAYTELNDDVLFKILYFDNDDNMQTQTSSKEFSGDKSLFGSQQNDSVKESDDENDDDLSLNEECDIRSTQFSQKDCDIRSTQFSQKDCDIRSTQFSQKESSDLTNKETQLKKAKEIIKRIFQRKLYACVYESLPVSAKEINNKTTLQSKTIEEIIHTEASKEIKKMKPVNQNNHVDTVEVEDIVVSIVYFDFGMKEENPVEKLKVYTKKNLTQAKVITKEESSMILGPGIYKEVVIRVYCRSLDGRKKQAIQSAAKKWFVQWNNVQETDSESPAQKRQKSSSI